MVNDFEVTLNRLVEFGKGRFKKYPYTEYGNELRLDDEVYALFGYVSQMRLLTDEMIDHIVRLAEHMNDTLKDFNGTLSDFLEKFDNKLGDNVKEILEQWQTSGYLNVVVSEAMQWELDQAQKYPVLSTEVGVTRTDFPYGDVRRYGAVGDILTDDTQAIKNALLSWDDVVLENVECTITEPITIPYRKGIRCMPNGFLSVSSNIDMVKLEARSKFVDMNIRVHELNYTSDIVEVSTILMHNNPDREVPEIHDIHVELDRPDYQQNGGTLFHIWAAKYDEIGNAYKYEGMCFLRIYNIRVDGGLEFFSREYTYRRNNPTSDGDGWLTDTTYENIVVNSVKHTFFGSRSELTLADPKFRSADYNRYNNISVQGGDSQDMFYFTHGNHFIGEYIPWDWRKVSNRVPIKIKQGSATKVSLQYLALSGGILANIEMDSYPSYIALDSQKQQHIKGYLSANTNAQSSVTPKLSAQNPTSRQVTTLYTGETILLGESTPFARNYLTFMLNDVYVGSPLAQQETKVTIMWNKDSSSASYYTDPFYDVSTIGDLYFHNTTVDGKQVIRFYMKPNKDRVYAKLYAYSPVEAGDNNWDGQIAFAGQKVSAVPTSSLTPITLNTSVFPLPMIPRSNNLYAKKGSLIYDTSSEQMRVQKDTSGTKWIALLEQQSGTTANRPTGANTGYVYFDTTLGKPIWFNGTGWVDSTGTSV